MEIRKIAVCCYKSIQQYNDLKIKSSTLFDLNMDLLPFSSSEIPEFRGFGIDYALRKSTLIF